MYLVQKGSLHQGIKCINASRRVRTGGATKPAPKPRTLLLLVVGLLVGERVVGELVVVVSGLIVVVGSGLVAVVGGLVAVGGGLVAVAGGLVAVGGGLVAVGGGLVVVGGRVVGGLVVRNL